jgi:hypothetical protein
VDELDAGEDELADYYDWLLSVQQAEERERAQAKGAKNKPKATAKKNSSST